MAPLREAQIPQVARMLARAFDDDPAYGYLIPASARRVQGLEDFFARNLRTHLPYACTYVWTDETGVGVGEVRGTVTVRPPGGVPISTSTMLRRGLIPFATRQGPRAVQRLFRLKRAYDAIETSLSNQPYRYVHMMAVAPSHQGQGLGSKLLAAALQYDKPSEAVPTVLTTHKPRNETFYRRAGFHTLEVRQLQLEPALAPYPVWCMRRD